VISKKGTLLLTRRVPFATRLYRGNRMKIEINTDNGKKEIEVGNGLDVSVNVGITELSDKPETVCVLNIENAEGLISRSWILVKIKNGRPQIQITTKPDKHRLKEVSKTVTGTFNTF